MHLNSIMEIPIMAGFKASSASCYLSLPLPGTAQAKVVDLGIGGANLFSLNTSTQQQRRRGWVLDGPAA